MTDYNKPGAPANLPQHILDQKDLPQGGDIDRLRWKHKQTGADPHPSDEEHPYRAEHPGVSRPVETRQISPNDARHDGRPAPRPRNAETE